MDDEICKSNVNLLEPVKKPTFKLTTFALFHYDPNCELIVNQIEK